MRNGERDNVIFYPHVQTIALGLGIAVRPASIIDAFEQRIVHDLPPSHLCHRYFGRCTPSNFGPYQLAWTVQRVSNRDIWCGRDDWCWYQSCAWSNPQCNDPDDILPGISGYNEPGI